MLIKAVNRDKPKMLSGLDQKVRGQVRGLQCPPSRMTATGRKARPYPGVIEEMNEVTPVVYLRGKADRKGG